MRQHHSNSFTDAELAFYYGLNLPGKRAKAERKAQAREAINAVRRGLKDADAVSVDLLTTSAIRFHLDRLGV